MVELLEFHRVVGDGARSRRWCLAPSGGVASPGVGDGAAVVVVVC